MARNPLDAIPKTIHRSFRNILRSGTLRREVPGGLDQWGDPVAPAIESHPFRGQREDYRADFRATAGIPQEDCRIMIAADSIAIRPRQMDQLQLQGQWFSVRSIENIDPAAATYTLQCTEITAPTP